MITLLQPIVLWIAPNATLSQDFLAHHDYFFIGIKTFNIKLFEHLFGHYFQLFKKQASIAGFILTDLYEFGPKANSLPQSF
jgi:hypothetical protein